MDRVQKETVQQLKTISPTTNQPILSRDEPSDTELQAISKRSADAFSTWSKTDLFERQKVVKRAIELLREREEELGRELTEQMGRPIAYVGVEIKTAAKRAEYMLKISEASLKDTEGEQEQGFKRYIKKVPVGPVLVIFAWNVCNVKLISSSNNTDNLSSVSVPNLGQLDHPGTSIWEHCYHQALTTDTDCCRTDD